MNRLYLFHDIKAIPDKKNIYIPEKNVAFSSSLGWAAIRWKKSN